jgi:hypothetical protein
MAAPIRSSDLGARGSTNRAEQRIAAVLQQARDQLLAIARVDDISARTRAAPTVGVDRQPRSAADHR